MPAQNNEQLKVFYCYAREDESLRNELNGHLISIQQEYSLTIWSDREIRPGADWAKEINAQLDAAHLIFLLITVNFIASKYCYGVEMKRALERHNAGTARVIPILLDHVYWQVAPFSHLQVLPTDARPVTEWENKNKAYVNIVHNIHKTIEDLFKTKEDTNSPKITNPSIDTSIWVGITRRVRELSLSKGTLLAVLALLLITSMAGGSYVWAVNTSHPVATVTAVTHNEATPTINNGIGVTLVEGEYIGISDGQDALDVAGRVPGVVTLMQEASKSLRNGNTDGAQKKWQEAHEKDTRYAEPLIYAENQRVKDSHRPYITIVLGVSLSDKGDGFSRDVLQGAYIAQRECNEDPQQSLSGGKMLRLLIAKSGSRPERSKDIAQQIVRAATSDGTIVGVQGWTTSQTTLEVVDILAAAHLPIVASDTDSDELTRKSPYFFRIGTPSSVYASLIAKYIEKNLASQRLVIFRDPKEPYSLSLSDALVNQFADDRYQRPIIRGFTTADKDNAGFAQQVQKVLTTDKPNLIYIATNDVNHVTALLNAIPPTQEYADLKVFAGGAGYELVQAETPFTGYTRMILSSSAFPDEWSLLAQGKPQPPFFEDYRATYDPLSQHSGSYTYSRANGAVMMDYDAVRVLLEASKIAIQAGKQNPTHNDIKNSLSQINALRPFQGITGAIKFGSDGNPIDKGRLILRVVDGGFLKVVAYQGCFLVGSLCDNENIQYWPP